ncbi:hypothetical protein ALC60_10236, partial [Trachymyrmex zeteki]
NMVGCTIPFCNNALKKGYVMKIIPRDTERRMKWVNSINSKYKNWTPSKNSSVYEVKFFLVITEKTADLTDFNEIRLIRCVFA